MLLSEQIHPFMVRTEDPLEPVECLIIGHLPHTADQVVRVRHDLLFRRQGKIVLPWKTKSLSLRSRNACPDVPFDDVDKSVRIAQVPGDLDSGKSVLNIVCPRPANVVEQAPEADQFPVHWFLYPFGNGYRHLGNLMAMSNNFRRASGLDKDINFTHKPVNNTTIL
jgi:hypothetical protein